MFELGAMRLPFAASVKAKLQAVVVAVCVLTLAVTSELAFNAKISEEAVRTAARADDESLDLLSFALITHRYVDELDQTLSDDAAADGDKLERRPQRFRSILA